MIIINLDLNPQLPEPAYDYDANGNVGEKVGESVGGNVGEILGITIQELASTVGISDLSIERNLQQLQKQNLLKKACGR